MPIKRKATNTKKPAKNSTIAGETTTKQSITAKKTAVKKEPHTKTATQKKAVKQQVAEKTAAEEPIKRSNATMKEATHKNNIAKKKPVNKKKVAKNKTEKAILTKKTVVAKKKSASIEEHINHDVIGPVAIILPYEAKPGEAYMNDRQLQHFKEVLLTWRHDLLKGVDKTVGRLKEDAKNYADLADRATQEEEFSLELRTRDRERKLLKKIEEAIQRVNDDDFGYCEVCGVEIGLPRLEVRPTATLCIDCKTVEEIREKQITL